MHIILIYIGIFAGVFFEGEMIMISSVIAAHHGYLKLWMVVVLGLTATYFSDCFYFFLGRRKGQAWINKNQKVKTKADLIIQRLERYPKTILVSYRFLYGFRSITPLVIGAGTTMTRTFMVFSAMGTIVWAAVYTTVGYLFGAVIKSQLGHIEHIEKYIIGVLCLTGVAFFLMKRLTKTRNEVKLV